MRQRRFARRGGYGGGRRTARQWTSAVFNVPMANNLVVQRLLESTGVSSNSAGIAEVGELNPDVTILRVVGEILPLNVASVPVLMAWSLAVTDVATTQGNPLISEPLAEDEIMMTKMLLVPPLPTSGWYPDWCDYHADVKSKRRLEPGQVLTLALAQSPVGGSTESSWEVRLRILWQFSRRG